jgi:hypothetical protein
MGFLTNIVFIGVCIGLFNLLYQANRTANPSVIRALKMTHFLTLGCSALWLYLNFAHATRFEAEWVNKTTVVLALLTGSLTLVFGRAVLKKAELRYFKLIQIIPLMLFITLLLPFVGSSIVVYFISPPGKVLYEDSNIKIQETYYGVLQGKYAPDIYEKRLGLFKTRKTSFIDCSEDVHWAEVTRENNLYKIEFRNETMNDLNCGIEYKID